ncbi:hypothetical protein JHL18_15610 [Clostridium sp. YIM B02505]|uniref:Uncharacterized protein n=1 Tax=Clostridium yunnanense TaxID=2800325 RepID=A0ABS1ERN0_9CLOT|nr:DUF6063 family protein [Clostridium yunnanense]MBK1812049.1 hypothetical protein [Clostridium yunnanense]
MIQDSDFDKAQEIAAYLLKHNELLEDKEKYLYSNYIIDTVVQSLVQKIILTYDLNLIEYNRGLYITPGVNNQYFGYKNDELKVLLKVDSNNEIYLVYFIMYTIITMFYKETAYATYKDYITNTEVVKRVDTMVRAITVKKSEEITYEESSLHAIREKWLDMDETPVNSSEITLDSSRKSNYKYSFVNRTLAFLVGESILFQNKQERSFAPTDKFKALIADFFDRKDVKNILVDFAKGDM